MREDRSFWTNPSVLTFSKGVDPIHAITEHARRIVLEALENGWSGPPFDPFDLAERMGIHAVAVDGIEDARTIAPPNAGLRIEYNPSRPRGRLRFSVAHELAHTFFSDCAVMVRNRLRHGLTKGNEWQLELLCNIAAAEILMPIGTIADLEIGSLRLHDLLELRKKFDVSTEAMLLRVARLADEPGTVFAVARADDARADSPFRVDYAVDSRAWNSGLRSGATIGPKSVLADCTAVGFTARGVEHWPQVPAPFEIECVGIPPYPGQRFPRVVGLLRPRARGKSIVGGINYVFGDATQPRGSGSRLIVHLVNDRTPNWGGPFALALKRRWPSAQLAFRSWTAESKSRLTLGNTHFFEINEGLAVATMIAQRGYGPSSKPRIRYSVLRKSLLDVAKIARDRGASVHMPRIGAGQAGGRWEIVRELIDEALCAQDVTVCVYTLPTGELSGVPPPLLRLASRGEA